MRPMHENIVALEFDVRDWENGFFVTFRLPYSHRAYAAVIALRNSANIKLLRSV